MMCIPLGQRDWTAEGKIEWGHLHVECSRTGG
jgi:hypothetical protein